MTKTEGPSGSRGLKLPWLLTLLIWGAVLVLAAWGAYRSRNGESLQQNAALPATQGNQGTAPAVAAHEAASKEMSVEEHLAAAKRVLQTAEHLSQLQIASKHLEVVREKQPKNRELGRLSGLLAKKTTAVYLAQKEAAASDNSVRMMAHARCLNFIEDSLKAPSTADFQNSLLDYVHYDGKFTWTVRTQVDAENSFGAKLRSTFTCKVRCLGADSCEVIKLTEH